MGLVFTVLFFISVVRNTFRIVSRKVILKTLVGALDLEAYRQACA